MKYTIGEGMRSKINRASSLVIEATSLLSEVENELSRQEEYEYDRQNGVDDKGDN